LYGGGEECFVEVAIPKSATRVLCWLVPEDVFWFEVAVNYAEQVGGFHAVEDLAKQGECLAG